MDPTDAQVPNAQDAQTPVDPSAPTDSNQEAPVQKRIGEIVAQREEAKRRAEAAEAANQQMMAAMAQQSAQLNAMMARQNEPAKQPDNHLNIEIPEGMDPAQAAFFTKLTQGFQAQLEHQSKQNSAALQAQVGQLRQTQAELQLQAALNNQPPAVAKRAAELMKSWQVGGFTGWSPQDAIIYARGELGAGAAPPPPRANPNGDVMQFGAAPPAIARHAALPPPMPDETLRRMTLKQQEDYWAKRVGDSPLEY